MTKPEPATPLPWSGEKLPRWVNDLGNGDLIMLGDEAYAVRAANAYPELIAGLKAAKLSEVFVSVMRDRAYGGNARAHNAAIDALLEKYPENNA